MSGRSQAPRIRRLGWLWLPLLLCFSFLYVPIVALVVMSFNSGKSALNFSGLSLRWYPELFRDGDLGEALLNSLLVAVGCTLVSTVLGTMLAVGLVRHTRSTALDSMVMAPAILPDLMLAIGLLSFFAAVGVSLGLTTVALAHAAFGTAFVVAVVRARLVQLDRSLEEASQDLGAGWFTTFTADHAALDRPGRGRGLPARLHAVARRVRDRLLHQRADQPDPADRDLLDWCASA